MSARVGEGLDELLAAVETTVAEIGVFGHGSGGSGGAEPPLLTRERHRRHATGCLAALDAFLGAAEQGLPVELAADFAPLPATATADDIRDVKEAQVRGEMSRLVQISRDMAKEAAGKGGARGGHAASASRGDET